MMIKPASYEFSSSIRDEDIRTLRILHLAFAMGIVFFGAVPVLLYNMTPVESVNSDVNFNLLTLVTAAISIVMFPAGFFISGSALKNVSKRLGQDAQLSLNDALIRIRSALIMRIAFFEAPSIFGMVVCILSIYNFVLQKQPYIALNTLPALLMVVLILKNLPTRDSLTRLYDIIN
jgi:hypothetical protein